MLSYSNFPTINYFTDALPSSQMKPCKTTDSYVYERSRLGKQRVSASGEQYGPYLYRNTSSGVLIASWNKPDKPNGHKYSACDIGMNADALIYYKNE